MSVVKIVHLAGAGLCALALLLGGCSMCKDDRKCLLSGQGGVFIFAGIYESCIRKDDILYM